jgi:hypothetical protein
MPQCWLQDPPFGRASPPNGLFAAAVNSRSRQGRLLESGRRTIGEMFMSTIEQYRAHAEDCLRLANNDQNERDRPLWLTLAQSWLQLAEHADRVHATRHDGEPEHEWGGAGRPDV